MNRFTALATISVVGLLAAVAAAAPALPKPGSKAPPPKGVVLDAVWTKQLAAKTGPKVASLKTPIEAKPNFAKLRKMTTAEKASALETAPAQVSGPLQFSARSFYKDARNYLEVYSGSGTVSVRSGADYVYFHGSDAAFATPFTRPTAEITFTAEKNRRYLLECAIDITGGGAGTVTAQVGGGPVYSVSGSDKATLILIHDSAGTSMQQTIQIRGDRPWYLDGCELSWTGS